MGRTDAAQDARLRDAQKAESEARWALDSAISDEASGGDPRRELSTHPFVDAYAESVRAGERARLAGLVRGMRTAHEATCKMAECFDVFDDVLALLESPE